MKVLFSELEYWETKYAKAKLPDFEVEVTKDKIDKDHLPGDRDAEVISVFVGSEINKEILKAFPKLKLIATRSTGYDHIDLVAAKKQGVIVSNVPTYGENTVAEHAFGLILSLAHKIFEGYDRIKETGSFSSKGLEGFDLKGKTLGVVGVGNIGRHIVRMAKGFEMNVVAFDVNPDDAFAKKMGFEYLPFEEVLAKSDIVTLHVPYLKSTHHLINKDSIKKMKHGAVLINTARGGIVETEALVKALLEGHLGGAGLDVLEEEGIIKDEREALFYGHPEEHNLKTVLANHVLIDLPNVIITPHNAFNTKESAERILDTTIENIASFGKNKPQNVVGAEQ